MRTSNKVLLSALGVLLALFLAFVLTMSLGIRDLIRERGRTARAGSQAAATLVMRPAVAAVAAVEAVAAVPAAGSRA
jgi:hypothetical protein